MSLNLAAPKRQLVLQKWGGLYLDADPRDLPEGSSPLNWDVDYEIAGVNIRPGLSLGITSYETDTPGVFEWLTTSELPAGATSTIAQDSGGRLWSEELTSPGTMTPIYSGILNNARAISLTVNNREYICLSNLVSGQDQPRQWDGTNLDRISQVGPGSGPGPPIITEADYTISSIEEIYPVHGIDTVIWGALLNDVNAPPPSTSLFLMGAGSDNTFTVGLSIGDYVYVSGVGSLEGQNPNGTYQVNSIGYFTDTNGVHQYFGVTTTVSVGDFVRGGSTGQYQKTQALIHLSIPIPQQNAVIGQNVTIAGSSVQGWNGVWPIVATPTEGQLFINSTSLTSNVATYGYSLVSGNPPGWQPSYQYVEASQIVDPGGNVWEVTTPGTSAGSDAGYWGGSTQTDGTVIWTKLPGVQMTVIVFNTSNGNGIFNVQGAVITSATSDTFTTTIVASNVTTADEEGQAVNGSGAALIIDPGAVTAGTGNPGVSPIFGAATGGQVLVPNANVAAGQRYAVCLFLTRDNFITPASSPVSFYTTDSVTKISFPRLPIGPPNIIARIVAMTAANSGVGGPYFWIPEDVILEASTQTLGQTQTINKTVIYDNTSTTIGPLTLNDNTLINSTNISVAGNNLQQQRELGECIKAVQFAGRVFYLGELTKVDEFLNLTFDGGSISGLPAGWSIASGLIPYVSLQTSPIFGQSLYIKNTSGSTINPTGTTLANMLTLYQTAYETAFQSPIIEPNTAYSLRITVRIPSGIQTGSPEIVVGLYSPGSGQEWHQLVSFNVLGTTFTEWILPLGNTLWQTVPSDLVLRVYPLNLTAGADVEIDRIEIFPTQQPVYTGQVIGSYFENSEAVDNETGPVSIAQWTSEPATNHFYLKFTKNYYITTATQTFVPITGDTEPSSWNVEPIAGVGCCGPLAEDSGEDYDLMANQDGLYVFDGGVHVKISQEIQPIWDSIYQPSISTIWVKDDISAQRILVGVPLPIPNQWLPNAPINAEPSTPNVLLMCSYLGLMSGRNLGEEAPVRVSMFTGSLLWRDMGRKWTIWQIPAVYANFITRPDGSAPMWFAQQGQISELDASETTDNGAAIDQTYFTYPLSDNMNEQKLQLGSVRKLYGYASLLIEGEGSFDFTVYPETLDTPYLLTQPAFTLHDPALDDQNIPLNTTGNRMFTKVSVDGEPGTWFSLKHLVMGVWPDSKIPVSGR